MDCPVTQPQPYGAHRNESTNHYDLLKNATNLLTCRSDRLTRRVNENLWLITHYPVRKNAALRPVRANLSSRIWSLDRCSMPPRTLMGSAVGPIARPSTMNLRKHKCASFAMTATWPCFHYRRSTPNRFKRRLSVSSRSPSTQRFPGWCCRQMANTSQALSERRNINGLCSRFGTSRTSPSHRSESLRRHAPAQCHLFGQRAT